MEHSIPNLAEGSDPLFACEPLVVHIFDDILVKHALAATRRQGNEARTSSPDNGPRLRAHAVQMIPEVLCTRNADSSLDDTGRRVRLLGTTIWRSLCRVVGKLPHWLINLVLDHLNDRATNQKLRRPLRRVER